MGVVIHTRSTRILEYVRKKSRNCTATIDLGRVLWANNLARVPKEMLRRNYKWQKRAIVILGCMQRKQQVERCFHLFLHIQEENYRGILHKYQSTTVPILYFTMEENVGKLQNVRNLQKHEEYLMLTEPLRDQCIYLNKKRTEGLSRSYFLTTFTGRKERILKNCLIQKQTTLWKQKM